MASCLEPYREYLAARFADDAHVEGTVLFGEVLALGFGRWCVTFVRELRTLGLRARCEACRIGGHGVTTVIAHEPGEEIQWDWLELRETPWGEPAYVLVGALSFSGRCRAVICEGQTFAHLVEAIDGVLRRLGGTSRAWRTDRIATVVHPGTDRITASFAQLAKHYGVQVLGLSGTPAAAQGVSWRPRSNTSRVRGGAPRRSRTWGRRKPTWTAGRAGSQITANAKGR